MSKGKLLTTGCACQIEDVQVGSVKDLQNLIGNIIQLARFKDGDHEMIVAMDEEGLLKHLEYNQGFDFMYEEFKELYGHGLVGDVVVMKFEDFQSIETVNQSQAA